MVCLEAGWLIDFKGESGVKIQICEYIKYMYPFAVNSIHMYVKYHHSMTRMLKRMEISIDSPDFVS